MEVRGWKYPHPGKHSEKVAEIFFLPTLFNLLQLVARGGGHQSVKELILGGVICICFIFLF